jgi:hypothetical protein
VVVYTECTQRWQNNLSYIILANTIKSSSLTKYWYQSDLRISALQHIALWGRWQFSVLHQVEVRRLCASTLCVLCFITVAKLCKYPLLVTRKLMLVITVTCIWGVGITTWYKVTITATCNWGVGITTWYKVTSERHNTTKWNKHWLREEIWITYFVYSSKITVFLHLQKKV